MTEQEIRQLVRDAIARVGGGPAAAPAAAPPVVGADPAFALLNLPVGADASSDGGGPCIIEPAVACNHCGYCKSYGH